MYCQFFGFLEIPFNVTPDPRFLFLGAAHREALASLIYGIKQRQGITAIVGEVGAGKTTVLNALMAELDDSIKLAYVFNTSLTFRELLEMTLIELGLMEVGESIAHRDAIYRLNEFAIKQLAGGGTVALVVDEAQNLDRESMESLRLLSNLETTKQKLIQIVVSGQPELDDRIKHPSLKQLAQRISLKRFIGPLNKEEIAAYIQHRLAVAGYRGKGLFDLAALSLIGKYSKGIPRKINILCANSLLIAYGMGKRRIGARIVQEAIRDLDWRLTSEMQAVAKKQGPEIASRGRRSSKPGITAYALMTSAMLMLCTIAFVAFAGGGWMRRSAIPAPRISAHEENPVHVDRPEASLNEASQFTFSSLPALEPQGSAVDRNASSKSAGSEGTGFSSPEKQAGVTAYSNGMDGSDVSAGTLRGRGAPGGTSVHPTGFVIAEKGDYLSRIIEKSYGRYSEQRLSDVLGANPGITDPDVIHVKQIIRLPVLADRP